jgi:hypothetical protein
MPFPSDSLSLSPYRLLSLPKEHFPPFFAMNLQPVMSMLVRVVATIDDEEVEMEDDEELDLDEDDLEANEEAAHTFLGDNGAQVSRSTLKKLSKLHIPEDGYGEDEDCINVADEDYLEAMADLEKKTGTGKKYDQYGGDLDDEDEDDLDEIDEPDTPLDAEDMTLLFCDAMTRSFHREPELFGALQNGLDEEDKKRLQVILETAEYRRNHPDGDDEDDDDEEGN